MGLSEEAYINIKKNIIFKEHENRYISVRKTARNLNMSYTPVREAFKKLESEGLLDRIPNLGYIIPKISNKGIDKIFQARECIETFVFKKTFDKLSEEDISNLKDIVEVMEKALKEKNIVDFYKFDKKFHMYFFEKYDNTYLEKNIKNIRERYHVCSQTLLIGKLEENKHIIKEHETIIKNIENKNKEKALESLRLSIEKSRERLKNGNVYV